MISKEKKAEIIAAYGRTPERYRITGGSDRYLNSTYRWSLPLIFRRTRRIIIPEEVC